MEKIQTEEKKNKEMKKSISKEIDKKTSTKVFINLLIAIVIMAYFCIMSVVNKNILQTGIVDIVKVTTLGFLFITIVLIEIAYKKESLGFLIHAFEALIMAVHSLTTMHVIKIYNFDFQNYILTSSYIFSIYYVLKAIIISTKARRDYLKGLSDIAEIVQKEEPSKKEASKREKIVEDEEIEEKKVSDRNKKQDKDSDNEKTEEETIKKEKNNIRNSKIESIKAKLEKIQNKEINEEKTKKEVK